VDWSFYYKPVTKKGTRQLPEGEEYLRYSNQHFNELIDKYNPDILWNDMGLEQKKINLF
jgi:hypothetical protein